MTEGYPPPPPRPQPFPQASYPQASYPQVPYQQTPTAQAPPRDNRDLRAGASIVVALAVIGALLGVVWGLWSPPGSAARITPAGRLQDETEAWVAADGRYLVLAAAIGLVAALTAWRRTDARGPVVLVALVAGGIAGSALMWLVGWLTGGGSDTGRADGFIAQQRVSLHVDGLLFLQAGVSVLVYGLLVAFTARDDLGRTDPVRDRLHAQRRAQYPLPQPVAQAVPPPGSVGAGTEAQYGGRDGDAAGPLQQRDLPPQ